MVFLLALFVSAVVAALVFGFIPKARAVFSPKGEVRVISDLDAIISETVGFRFEGKVYEIPPLTLETFIIAVQHLAVLDGLKNKEKVTPEELLSAYTNLFSLVCPKVTRATVETMGHQRIAALLGLIIEVIMGKATLDAEKKRPQTSTEALNLQSAPV
jgi:hypothetical protein